MVAEDDAGIGPRLLHGQWSSPSLGRVGERTLVFLGGGDGVCYAFEALAAVPDKPVKLKTVWSCDCNPPEYKVFGDLDLIAHYSRGDRRRSDHINNEEGTFAGMSEIIATPVFYNNRVYIAIGRDPEHGRGRGMLWCIDATKTGDVTTHGQGLDLPRARPLAVHRVDRRRTAVHRRRGRAVALPGRGHRPAALDSRRESRHLGLDVGRRRQGVSADPEAVVGAWRPARRNEC